MLYFPSSSPHICVFLFHGLHSTKAKTSRWVVLSAPSPILACFIYGLLLFLSNFHSEKWPWPDTLKDLGRSEGVLCEPLEFQHTKCKVLCLGWDNPKQNANIGRSENGWSATLWRRFWGIGRWEKSWHDMSCHSELPAHSFDRTQCVQTSREVILNHYSVLVKAHLHCCV